METPNKPQSSPQPSAKQGRIASFLHRVARSCYDMEFYRGVRLQTWGKALTYQLVLQAVITAVMTAFVVPAFWTARGEAMQYIAKEFPAGAAIATHGGKITSSFEAPFTIRGDEFEVVIDTGHVGLAPSDAFGQMPGVFIGQDVIVMKDGQKLTTYEAKKLPDVSFTREKALDWLRTWSLLVIAAATLAFACAYFIGANVAVMLYVTLAALAMLGIGRIWKVRVRYEQWHAIGLHAVTLPTFVNFASSATNFTVPYAFTFIYFMIMAAVIADEKARPVPAAAA